MRYQKAINLQKQLLAYRKMRKLETGKMMLTQTAIDELLDKALTGVEPDRVIEFSDLCARLASIERRLKLLEARK